MKLFVLILVFTAEVFSSLTPLNKENFNTTNDDVLSREKRFLLFVPNGGILQFISGYLGPIDIPSWQNVNCLRNIRYQYELPQKWYTKFAHLPGVTRSQGRSLDENPAPKPDATRKVAYEVVETILDREGKNGHECMLRAICEVAETPVNHNGLIGELMQLFFTPGSHEKLHEDYRHARKAGLNRVNCEKLYPDCPFGHGVLDSISLVEEFKFKDWLNF